MSFLNYLTENRYLSTIKYIVQSPNITVDFKTYEGDVSFFQEMIQMKRFEICKSLYAQGISNDKVEPFNSDDILRSSLDAEFTEFFEFLVDEKKLDVNTIKYQDEEDTTNKNDAVDHFII